MFSIVSFLQSYISMLYLLKTIKSSVNKYISEYRTEFFENKCISKHKLGLPDITLCSFV